MKNVGNKQMNSYIVRLKLNFYYEMSHLRWWLGLRVCTIGLSLPECLSLPQSSRYSCLGVNTVITNPPLFLSSLYSSLHPLNLWRELLLSDGSAQGRYTGLKGSNAIACKLGIAYHSVTEHRKAQNCLTSITLHVLIGFNVIHSALFFFCFFFCHC